jgi:hypothetical protein
MRVGEGPGTQNSRRSHREPVMLAGSAFGISRSRSVVISDLCPEGAQLDGRDLPPPGDDLVMVVGSFDTMAKVVWCSGDKCGVHFDEVVAYETLTRMKQEAQWTAVAGWYR